MRRGRGVMGRAGTSVVRSGVMGHGVISVGRGAAKGRRASSGGDRKWMDLAETSEGHSAASFAGVRRVGRAAISVDRSAAKGRVARFSGRAGRASKRA